jgi:hypothetical protein
MMPTNLLDYARSLSRIHYLIIIDLRYLLARLGNESPIKMLRWFSNVDMREARTKKAALVMYRQSAQHIHLCHSR